jgi:hypothetical protein
MPRYQIWNKQDNVYTLAPDETGKAIFTPDEWIAKYPWADIPGVKSIIGGGAINGTVMMQFDMSVDMYKRSGAAIMDDMTDDEILAAIEDFENNPPGMGEPSPEERMAAALEYQAMMAGEE